MIGTTCMLLCGSSCVRMSRSGPRVRASTRPSLCPLGLEGGVIEQSSGEFSRENDKACLQPRTPSLRERSDEAIQDPSAKGFWIVSSQGLLAMMLWRECAGMPANYSAIAPAGTNGLAGGNPVQWANAA